MGKVINQIDHILVQTKYAKETFNVLVKVLDLPIAWDIKDFKNIFISGGICFGNINIEILNYEKVLRDQKIVPDKEGSIGIAFEPINSIEETVMELNKQGLKHGKIEPFNEHIHGKNKTLWTNLFMKKLLGESQIFFCKYEADIQKRRTRLSNDLKNRQGGKIKIESVKEIVIGYSQNEILEKWKKISSGEEENIRSFECGPKIRFVKNAKNEILSILLKVESIDKAKKAIEDNELVLINEDNELLLKAVEIQNLGFKLCE